MNFTMDVLANNEGTKEEEAARTITNDAGARSFFKILNGDKLNGKIRVYNKYDPRVAIFQYFQRPILHLAEISRGLDVPSMTTDAFIDRAVEIAKKLERLDLTKQNFMVK